MSLKAMPTWIYQGTQDDYQFNDVVKPENLTRLPPLDERDVSNLKLVIEKEHRIPGTFDFTIIIEYIETMSTCGSQVFL